MRISDWSSDVCSSDLGVQAPFNMRRTIIADEQGRYRFRSILPSGYGVPPGSPTEKLLTALGRHGQRPAHIHFFISADDHRKLTTQINIRTEEHPSELPPLMRIS